MTHHLQILVVDDEPGMRMGVQRALREYSVQLPDSDGEIHFEIDQAETGEEAMGIIKANMPDILLLDHKLPGISGLDVLQQIGSISTDMLTVMITAYASIQTAITATKRGAYDFLAKPFTPDDLRHIVDKTARHLMVQRKARRLAIEKRQVRFQLISVLAHELKAPLAAIEGFLQIIQNRSAGEDQAVYDHMLLRSLTRLEGMRKMIADLLDLTRIESGQKSRELVSVDVHRIATESIDMFASQLTAQDIEVALCCDDPLMMMADKSEIESILNNLLSNAIKYNRQDGRIDMTLSSDDDIVTIRVADTGIGMTKEETDRLFEEFVRIKNPKTRNILGSGLGLSIVKKVALLYSGQVTVTSEPDVGTTFVVTLLQTKDTSEDELQGDR